MSDPRSANTDRIGVAFRAETYKADGSGDIVFDATLPGRSAAVGKAVTLSGNGQIRLTADGSDVLGKLISVSDDLYCSVQVEGVATMPSAGTITAQSKIVGALITAARGGIRSVVAATLADVAAGRHVVLNAADAANVEVELAG